MATKVGISSDTYGKKIEILCAESRFSCLGGNIALHLYFGVFYFVGMYRLLLTLLLLA